MLYTAKEIITTLILLQRKPQQLLIVQTYCLSGTASQKKVGIKAEELKHQTDNEEDEGL